MEVSFDNEFFRISLFKQSIFLSGPKINAVLEYQQDNQTRHYHQLAYDVTSFDMYWPHIGPCDEEGNLLVIDELNGRFAVLMADKTWQLLQVKRRCRPCDVALDSKKRVLVLNFDARSLCKLVPRPRRTPGASPVDDVVKSDVSNAELSTLANSTIAHAKSPTKSGGNTPNSSLTVGFSEFSNFDTRFSRYNIGSRTKRPDAAASEGSVRWQPGKHYQHWK